MAQEETRKKKTGMARCLELASQHKALFLSQAFLPQQPQCALSYRIFLSIL